MRMDELAAPAIEVVRSGRGADPPRVTSSGVYLDWMENIRPWCISRQLWWGHQIPVWYRGERDLRRHRARPRARAGSATPTCSTPGSAQRCGRSRRSAGPSRPPELRAFYPTDVALDRARHHLPVGRADGDDGPRVHRRDPVRRRLRPLDHPGARRAADVEVARHRRSTRRPDRRGRDRRRRFPRAATSRPTAPTRCASACWRCPPARTCSSPRTRSPRASSWRTSCGTPPG